MFILFALKSCFPARLGYDFFPQFSIMHCVMYVTTTIKSTNNYYYYYFFFLLLCRFRPIGQNTALSGVLKQYMEKVFLTVTKVN